MENVLKLIPQTKTCSICKVGKPLDEFSKNKGMKFGVSVDCKICRNEKRTAKRTAIRKERELNWTAPLTKVCTRCHVEKPREAFAKNGDRKI